MPQLDVATVIERLSSVYGRPEPPAVPPTSLDELVLTILSQNTNDVNRDKAFDNLQRLFPTWEIAQKADPSEIEEAIRVGGLARQKSQRIHRILTDLKQERGSVSLDFLSDMTMSEAHDYLIGMKGVGEKTAACVLLFSLHMPALPVDTHVHRLALRMGLARPGSDETSTMMQLLDQTPEKDRYALHILLITHGRKKCHSRKPECGTCILSDTCPKLISVPSVTTSAKS